eukprot:NODE_265_length_2567_cov_6.914615_g243_i0.p1 GENE.NODE_265_length_2567_cov_6.914615_g243_i0~~NODE_265_length_2567_cov_6.914615_g243_i0.p1  ORF type:complete len:515 (+),score=-114.64 NODE_265_length_2567_cov_6.914615_g243_i0:707-2251(+)
MKQNKIFQQQRMNKPSMSAFDLSREQKLSCQMGELVPTYLEEVLPGDQFRVKTESLVRFAPMIAPIMHRVDVFLHYFFVPNRFIWNEWEEFISGDQDGQYTSGETAPVMPKANLDYNAFHNEEKVKKLADYLGIPVNQLPQLTTVTTVSLLPFRAYQKIYNEYYRDPNLMDEVDLTASYNANSNDQITLKYRSWEKDYFTSALPFVQRGAALGVPIDYEYADNTLIYDISGSPVASTVGLSAQGTTGRLIDDSNTDELQVRNLANDVFDFQINELRRASALQRWLEKQALGGYRYIETIFSHFGVKSSDKRLQRPEYLGGGKIPVMVTEVLNTSATATEPQGNMSGHGITMGESMSFQTQVEEHGYIMGIMSIMPKPAYYQGIDKHWLRTDKFDYYWPELANLGEQEIKNIELYLENDTDINNATFGYQQRYAEYKYGKSSVHGDFRDSLDYWHLGRKFATRPQLNETFLEVNPADDYITNIFAVETGDNIWIQLYHDVKARRPMPYFANPQLT